MDMLLDSMQVAITFTNNEHFLNGVFIAMLSLIVLCHISPHFIARQQSNPYTIQVQWNFGVESFNFQLLNYDVYHANILTRWSHHLTIGLEAFLWMIVIRYSLGFYFSLFVVLVLLIQSISYSDRKFGAVMGSTWVLMALISEILLLTTDFSQTTFKTLIFYSVVIRTLSHVLEIVPPIVNGDHDKFSNQLALMFAWTDPWPATKALVFGILSEMASAIPGRLFPVVVYLVMSHYGHRSEILESVPETTKLSDQILRSGWSSYHLTAKLYSWARPSKVIQKITVPHA